MEDSVVCSAFSATNEQLTTIVHALEELKGLHEQLHDDMSRLMAPHRGLHGSTPLVQDRMYLWHFGGAKEVRATFGGVSLINDDDDMKCYVDLRIERPTKEAVDNALTRLTGIEKGVDRESDTVAHVSIQHDTLEHVVAL